MTHRRLCFVLLCFLSVALGLAFTVYASGKPVDENEWMFCLSFLGLLFLFLVVATYPPLAAKIDSFSIPGCKWEMEALQSVSLETRWILLVSSLLIAIFLHIYAGLNFLFAFVAFAVARLTMLVIIVRFRKLRSQ